MEDFLSFPEGELYWVGMFTAHGKGKDCLLGLNVCSVCVDGGRCCFWISFADDLLQNVGAGGLNSAVVVLLGLGDCESLLLVELHSIIIVDLHVEKH